MSDKIVGGAACVIVLGYFALAIAAIAFVPFIAFKVAEHFGQNGWVGVGLYILASAVVGAASRSKS